MSEKNLNEQDKPVANLTGHTLNIFTLVGVATKALRDAGQGGKARELTERVLDRHRTYDDALSIVEEYVDVV